MYSLDQELAFATQKVREQRAVIATLQSDLAAAKESAAERLSSLADDADRQLAQAMAIVRKQGDELKAAKSDLAAAREELSRAREALIKLWHGDWYPDPSEVEAAEARYTREISHAHKGEEG